MKLLFLLGFFCFSQALTAQCKFLTTDELRTIFDQDRELQEKALVATYKFKKEKVISGPTRNGYGRCAVRVGTSCEHFEESFFFNKEETNAFYQLYNKTQFDTIRQQIISQSKIIEHAPEMEAESDPELAEDSEDLRMYLWGENILVMFEEELSSSNKSCGLGHVCRIIFAYVKLPSFTPLSLNETKRIATIKNTNERCKAILQNKFDTLVDSPSGTIFARGLIYPKTDCLNYREFFYVSKQDTGNTFYSCISDSLFQSLQSKIIAEGYKHMNTRGAYFYEWNNLYCTFEIAEDHDADEYCFYRKRYVITFHIKPD